jgi:hypothetical protein
MRNRAFLRWIISLTLMLACASGQRQNHEMAGLITTPDGTPIEGVLVISSGAGLQGWAYSGSDGAFLLHNSGEFVSFRHAKYGPMLIRSSSLKEPVRVQLVPSNENWKLSSCAAMPGKGRAWIGGGLRVNPAGSYKGPAYGEHDSHWYLKRGKDPMHIVSGYAWHSGLPQESTLVRSTKISIREWVFDTIVGLDFTGQTDDGNYWRWVGAPLADAVEYEATSRSAADYFDGIIASLCFGGG